MTRYAPFQNRWLSGEPVAPPSVLVPVMTTTEAVVRLQLVWSLRSPGSQRQDIGFSRL